MPQDRRQKLTEVKRHLETKTRKVLPRAPGASTSVPQNQNLQ
eukprot:CAMPEP_0115231804 /NCGR_PEP_ID=MMETSP0270-20121206/33428_1 /TAXON_ID=71861 /ORGANISM="Scrippsiella trochoidea, Strain CCMP3099" /LENGTH=41 /DNA_ID= /DNA_START= /DNA_END= /DNA_ORIENTATION=